MAKIGSLKPSRIDMGVDYSGSGDILALGDCEITYSSTASGWPGGGAVVMKLLNGQYKGKFIYYAEELTPLVKEGEKRNAGQGIATLHGGCEIGWASGQADNALAASLGQQKASEEHFGPSEPGGYSTAAGVSFNNLLVALGCPSGSQSPGGVKGANPPGYP